MSTLPDALNRSKSLPRPFIDDRRSSTPMRSEPASPKLGPSVSQRTPARDYGPSATFHALQPAMASLSVSGTLPRPPAPQRSQSSLTPASTAATSSGQSTSAVALFGTGTEPPSPVFGQATDGDGAATTSTPMSMSASAGPARYVGSSGPPAGSVAWQYVPSSSAAIAAAYQAAAAAAAAAVAAGYPASAAAFPYATPASMSNGSTGANVSATSTGSVPTPASVSLASYPSQTQASPMQYPQGFPAGATAYDHHPQFHARSSYGLDSSVGSLPSASNEDVFGTVSGAPMIPGMAMGLGYGGPAYLSGVAPAGGVHGVGLGMQGYHGVANGEIPQGASDYAGDDDEAVDEDAPSKTRREGPGDEASGSSSDLSEGVLDELARVSEIEATEDADSPSVGASEGAGLESTQKPSRTAGPDVDIPAASPAIDIEPTSSRLAGSRRQSGVGTGL
ncbi:hypothetical protein OC846_001470 [Tilletia horrida]|uniref:Uncharacterized protein n=1 Tax=Tilletia horrida TaxID=155126 RepID=A0AAN6JVY0_9BASI|nr:hypothetical protein OC846_001470 [Tilletia horrida]